MPTDEVLNAFSSGRAYCDAAHLVATHAESDGRDYLVLPTHTLIGVSVETLYKSVLLHKGVEQKDLMDFKVRHNLKALRDRARSEGFVSSTRVDEIIDHISDSYGSHEYRYMKAGGSVNKVDVMASVTVINELMNEVRALIGIDPPKN